MDVGEGFVCVKVSDLGESKSALLKDVWGSKGIWASHLGKMQKS